MKEQLSLTEIERVLQIQYILEALIESYDKAIKESDKYYVKLELINAIMENGFDIEMMVRYMKLQPEKFEPFIRTLENVVYSDDKSNQTLSKFKKQSKPNVAIVIGGFNE